MRFFVIFLLALKVLSVLCCLWRKSNVPHPQQREGGWARPDKNCSACWTALYCLSIKSQPPCLYCFSVGSRTYSCLLLPPSHTRAPVIRQQLGHHLKREQQQTLRGLVYESKSLEPPFSECRGLRGSSWLQGAEQLRRRARRIGKYKQQQAVVGGHVEINDQLEPVLPMWRKE